MAQVPLTRQPVVVLVDGFTHGGEGVGRIEGKAVFVPGTLPGERVVVRVVEDHKRWARAELLEIVVPSPDRVPPPCRFVPACGGCDLQHASIEAQRRLKTRVVTEQLQRIGRIADPNVATCRGVGLDLGYRSHAQLHADDDGRLGFRGAGSHDVVPIDACLVLTDAAQRLRSAIGDGTGAAGVTVRAHATTGTAAVVLEPGNGPLHIPEGPFDVALRQPDGSTAALRGDGVLAEDVAGLRFRFDATSFFQVSAAGAAAIVDEVLAAAGEVTGALAWDLYAGVGLLSLPLARAGAEVVAVEGHAPATGWLAENAAAADLEVTVVTSDVRRFVEGDHEPPDLVVLDPPRTGAGPEVMQHLAALRPATVVYVACDPAALARDARALTEHGYSLRSATPLDLFPMTHHVEVVAVFR